MDMKNSSRGTYLEHENWTQKCSSWHLLAESHKSDIGTVNSDSISNRAISKFMKIGIFRIIASLLSVQHETDSAKPPVCMINTGEVADHINK